MIKLMHGDCLVKMAELEAGSVDMVLTDPPYGMNYQSGWRTLKHKKIFNDDNTVWIKDFTSSLFRITKENSAHYLFSSYHKIDLFKQSIEQHFKVADILVWEKNNTGSGDLNGNFAPKVEFIIFFKKGKVSIKGKRDPNILRFVKTGNKYHPTEKPVALCAYLISKFSNPGDTVLDPFMGSGTTGVACVKTGRNFIGIELDKGYLELANKRIWHAKQSRGLLNYMEVNNVDY